jgi:hypothetical protein
MFAAAAFTEEPTLTRLKGFRALPTDDCVVFKEIRQNCLVGEYSVGMGSKGCTLLPSDCEGIASPSSGSTELDLAGKDSVFHRLVPDGAPARPLLMPLLWLPWLLGNCHNSVVHSLVLTAAVPWTWCLILMRVVD